MIRSPAVAGTFYPDDPAQLQQAVMQYINQGRASTLRPKAIIAPHAGYLYSGPIAGSAYRALQPLKETVQRVVLLGPSHQVAFRGIAAPTAEAFHTPLGEIPVDQPAIRTIADLPQLQYLDEPHQREHSLEVQLPFLQQVLDTFTLIPLVVGSTEPEAVAEVLERLWGGEETVIIVSSDLSHYLPYNAAQQLDQSSSRAIEQFDSKELQYESACGRLPINGLLQLARQHQLLEETIDVRNSGDTAGDRARVVGYGAYLFAEQTT